MYIYMALWIGVSSGILCRMFLDGDDLALLILMIS